MGRPKVSVCIPTHNRSRYLRQAIESVLRQTFGDYEVLVVDNASSDDTASVVSAFKDERVRYYRNERTVGMVRNWNRCLEFTRGECIALLHDDDFWLAQYLERAVGVMDRHGSVGLVYSAAVVVDQEGNARRMHRHWDTDQVVSGHSAFKELIGGNRVLCPTALVRRRCFDTVGVFDEGVECGADWEMWLRICLYYDVAYVAEPLACYRTQHGSLIDHHSSSLEGRQFLVNDAINVVERALNRARKAGVRDLDALAVPTLGPLRYGSGRMLLVMRRWQAARSEFRKLCALKHGRWRVAGLVGYCASLVHRDLEGLLRVIRGSGADLRRQRFNV